MLLDVLVPVLTLGGLGLLFAVLLIVANIIMKIQKDNRVAEVRQLLPGANCGACGYVGCDAYAKAIADEGAEITLCTPGGDETARSIAKYLDVQAGEVEDKVAFVACSGTSEYTEEKFDYCGIKTCRACNSMYGGDGQCNYTCLGFGDCVKVCRFDAIDIVDGIAVINRDKCTGCGMCENSCVNDLIKMYNRSADVFVRCHNTSSAAETHRACKHGCIACKKCEKVCPVDAIKVENNLAFVNQELCISCGECIDVCPVNVIVQFD